MVTRSWLFDAMIYMYALSLLFYFSDFANANRSAKRMGTGLLLFVWVLQTAYLGINLYGHLTEWAFARSDVLFMFSWLIVTISLLINRFFRIELFVFFVNVLGFAILALNVFSNPNVTPIKPDWDINDELLFIHITLAIGSYVAFSIAAIFSGMYVFLHKMLKAKKFSQTVMRLPSLEKIEHYTYLSVIIGAPLLLMALSLGVVWVVLEGDRNLLYDPKVINSFFVLAAYAFYLFQQHSMRISGNKLAAWNLAAFLIVVLNFVVSNLVSGFHGWIWS
ncbi:MULTISPECIES: inner membrane protein YpjD [unclassified Paenibacillus]|jgi:HemX protein|uniref:cytochrome C assembly family protein n=1 Tax=unclassified Paenibacillus TaxID=185978 RepID=UPI00277D21FE|nr:MULTISPECIES: cytochrome c biogenesis protein CcsA [unclassified Paenibacillus]MDF2649087.1 cytochrome assembly protein [Paenibacillus sp.]MDQ0901485.1 HemX protein [Paenibacillus sp. V4I7]MDQ0920013.1 HemX protein [Paenibacillus sp. V4I5]